MRSGDRVAIRVSNPWELSEANEWPKIGRVSEVIRKPRVAVVIVLDEEIKIPGSKHLTEIIVSSRYEGDDISQAAMGDQQIIHVVRDDLDGKESKYVGYGLLEVM